MLKNLGTSARVQSELRRTRRASEALGTGECVGYVGHSSHVVNVRFANGGRNVISVGGHDRAIFQWRVDAEVGNSLGTTTRPPLNRSTESFRASSVSMSNYPEGKSCGHVRS